MSDRLFACRGSRPAPRANRPRAWALCAAAVVLGCLFAPFERAAAQIRPGPRPIPPPGSFRFPTLRLLNGTADDDDQANALAVDAQDNVIAAGTTLNLDTGRDFTVAKFNRYGQPSWVRVEARELRGEALAVAVDSQQNVIAAGWERDGSGADFPIVRKYSPAGDLLFERVLAEDIGGVVIDRGSRILAVAVDGEDNIVAVGRLVTIPDFLSTRGEMLVWKLDPSGRETWRRQLAGTLPDGDSEARAVAIDPFNNIIVAGLFDNLNTGADAAVVKLRPDGSQVFRVERPDPHSTDDRLNSVAVDSSAAITVGGRVDGGFFVAGLDQSGGWSWVSSGLAPIRGGAEEEALCVRVGPGSNVFTAGYAQPNDPLALRFTVKSFDTFGLLNWHRQLGVAEGVQGAATSLAVDHLGNVAACGYLGSASSGEDFVTASFTATGVLRGQKSINGTANWDDRALAVTVDRNGWVTAAGKVRNNVVHQLFPAVSTALDDFAVAF